MPRSRDDEIKPLNNSLDGQQDMSNPSSMLTRSHCSGECPSNCLDHRSHKKHSHRITTARVVANGRESLPSTSIRAQKNIFPPPTNKNRPLNLAEFSDDEQVRRGDEPDDTDDDSSDEEITLVRRRTTNIIKTTIETSSRKMNSVHPSLTKWVKIAFYFLPLIVLLLARYYFDSPNQLQAPQHKHHQQLPQQPPLHSSSPFQPQSNYQSNCNVTTICPSSQEMAHLNKRLDNLEKIVLKLTEQSINGSSHMTAMNEKIQVLGKESRQNYAQLDERLNHVSNMMEEMAHSYGKAECKNSPSIEEIETIIRQAIYLYDSDKTGKADYALESSGGSIVYTRCSETYDPHIIKYTLWGIPWYTSNSPRTVIQASMVPGECWAFAGSVGKIAIKLSTQIIPTSFSYEHISKEISRDGDIRSAPKDIQIRGLRDEKDEEGILLGNYVYLDNDRPLQVFEVQTSKGRPFQYIELIVLSNHGHPDYTCLYRFRVHGSKL